MSKQKTTADRIRDVVAEVNARRAAPAGALTPARPNDAKAAALEMLRNMTPDQVAELVSQAVRENAASPVRPLHEMAPEELRSYRNALLPSWAFRHLGRDR